MPKIEDRALITKLQDIMKRYEDFVLTQLEGSQNLGFVVDDDPNLFVTKMYEDDNRDNPMTTYLMRTKHVLPECNFLMHFIRGKDFRNWDTFCRYGKWKDVIPKEKMREYANECIEYLEDKLLTTQEPEATFYRAFIRGLQRPGTSERF